MSDPMFRSFSQPLEVTPPDASEVRLRGERRARRTTIATVVGAVVLVLAVVAPVAALTNGDKKATPPILPSPSQTQKADGAWVRKVPDGFPLGDGIPMPGEASAATEHDKGLPLMTCRDGQSSLGQSAGWVDVATATNQGVVDPADGVDSRLLALYASGSDAEQAQAHIAAMYGECTPGAPGVGPQVAQRIGDGDAWVLTVADSSSPVAQLVTVERVGNALLVQQDLLRPANVRSFEEQLADVRAGQAQVVAAMCVFAAEPCTAPPPDVATPDAPTTSSPPVSHVDEIPAAFPIDVAYQDPGSEGQVHAPSAEGDPVLLQPCGVEAFAAPSQDQLFFQVTGPEYADTRELRTYPSADDAVAQMEQLRAAVADCPDGTTSDPATATIWSAEFVDTGYDSFAVAQTYEQGLGGGVWVFTRVGRSILALVEGGEFSAETARVRLPAVAKRAKQIAPSMCVFTEGGC
ncbi:hypothetical protein ACVW00_001026 [Marmoricola sp. URHA0025 HA25]